MAGPDAMSADHFLALLTQVLYVVIAAVVTYRAARHPTRAAIDTALFFDCVALIVAQQWVTEISGAQPGPFIAAASSTLLMAMPYLLLRLLSDFSTVGRVLQLGALAGLLVSAGEIFALLPDERPQWSVLLMVAYFFGLSLVVALGFVRETRQAGGVTRRRMLAVAGATMALGLMILAIGVTVAFPSTKAVIAVITRLLSMLSGIAFYVGFVPPAWLKATWQLPEVQAFLGRAGALTRLPTLAELARELEKGVASALGTDHASLGLFEADAGLLRFSLDGTDITTGPGEGVTGQSWASQRPIFSANPAREHPALAEVYARHHVAALLAAPITAGDRKLGVMLAYASRAPIFAEDDLTLLSLLCSQAAVLMESRILLEQAAEVQAREHATRLKDDFLSSAAHDLKTPLTALIMQAELLERRVQKDPQKPVDPQLVERMAKSGRRLRDLVLELLDAVQAERGVLRVNPQRVNFTEIVEEAVQLVGAPSTHEVRVEAEREVWGEFDRNRMLQVVANLVDNAVKYSPEGGRVEVRVARKDGRALLSVEDRGIGIPEKELPHVFERYRRADNATDDRRFHGLGLGLFIARAVVEQHAGTISVDSTVGKGTTFRISLPAEA